MFTLKHSPRLRPSIYAIGIVFLAIWVVLSSINRKSVMEQIQDRGYLRVATLAAPLSLIEIDGQRTGFEFELTTKFAESQGLEIITMVVEDHQHLFQALRDRRVDLIAANLHTHPSRTPEYRSSTPYRDNQTLIVYREKQGYTPPKSFEDLNRKPVYALDATAEAAQLFEYKDQFLYTPKLISDKSHLDLLTLLQNKEIELAMIPSDVFNRVASYHPELNIAFSIKEQTPSSWHTLKQEDISLENTINTWLLTDETQLLLADLEARSYPLENPLNFVDTHAFRRALETRYEALNPYFIAAGKEIGLDHHILAAVGYQESHWDKDAVSNTGVRGIMMLTQDTADEMGVSDRTDPEESIMGGAKYLRKVEDKIPERIPEPDRLWFAMAGYNVGFGHLEDARILTQKAGKNADRWDDVAQYLPLLEDPDIAKTTRYGAARGSEPVNYVANIQQYTKIIEPFRRLNQLRSVRLEPLD